MNYSNLDARILFWQLRMMEDSIKERQMIAMIFISVIFVIFCY